MHDFVVHAVSISTRHGLRRIPSNKTPQDCRPIICAVSRKRSSVETTFEQLHTWVQPADLDTRVIAVPEMRISQCLLIAASQWRACCCRLCTHMLLFGGHREELVEEYCDAKD